jgi:hypothetical protein
LLWISSSIRVVAASRHWKATQTSTLLRVQQNQTCPSLLTAPSTAAHNSLYKPEARKKGGKKKSTRGVHTPQKKVLR